MTGSLDLDLSPEASDVTLHEPIAATISLRNGLAEAVHVDLGLDARSHIVLTIRPPSGDVCVARFEPPGELSTIGEMTLAPGQAHVQPVFLDEWYDFAEPGTYRIEMSLAERPRTNSGAPVAPRLPGPLDIRVGSRDPDRLARLCDALRAAVLRAPGWGDAREAAHALGLVRDTIAVDFIADVLRRAAAPVWPELLPVLARLATPESLGVLLEIAQSPAPDGGPAAAGRAPLARSLLYGLRRRDLAPALKQKIDALFR
jgi:hypothetical protein